jgi:hypothetical protein
LNQRRLLQIAVALAGLVPVTAGALGAFAPEYMRLGGPASALTHLSYLSGLLLGIGLVFWSLVPTIERQSRTIALLTAIVVLGGLARLILALRLGVWSLSVSFPLVMELGVTPLLCLWQRRLAKVFPFGP